MNTDNTWRYFGIHDPYFGVLTDERFRRAALTEGAKANFFETGRDYVDRILGVLLDELGLSLEGRVGIDFGCGVGRLTIPLAGACRSVTGVDVSESMLAEARKNCARLGVDNVRFALSDDSLSTVRGPLGFVHSFLVFQHIRPARGERILKRMVDLLEPDGLGILHFTSSWSSSTPFVRRILADGYRWLPALYALRTLLKGQHLVEPLMQMHRYHAGRLLRILHESGCHRVHVRFTEGGHLGQPFYGVVLLFQKRSMILSGA